MKHLWEVDHAYYCNLGNYRANGCGFKYDSFSDFMDEWGDSDMDYNLLFRWDWSKFDHDDYDEEEYAAITDKRDTLKIFWMLQRKGDYRFCEIRVTEEDEPEILEFLKPRWEYMKRLWEPFSDPTESPSEAAAEGGSHG